MRVGFDRTIKLDFHGARVSSDAGLFPYRDLDEAAELTESAARELFDSRTGTNIRHGMTALLRQSIYRRLAGYEVVNDAERLPMRRFNPQRDRLACSARVQQIGFTPHTPSGVAGRVQLGYNG